MKNKILVVSVIILLIIKSDLFLILLVPLITIIIMVIIKNIIENKLLRGVVSYLVTSYVFSLCYIIIYFLPQSENLFKFQSGYIIASLLTINNLLDLILLIDCMSIYGHIVFVGIGIIVFIVYIYLINKENY